MGLTEVSVAVNDERKLGMPLFHSGRVSLFFESDQIPHDGGFFLLATQERGPYEKINKIASSAEKIIIFSIFIDPDENEQVCWTIISLSFRH
jgi:hypothetical protein